MKKTCLFSVLLLGGGIGCFAQAEDPSPADALSPEPRILSASPADVSPCDSGSACEGSCETTACASNCGAGGCHHLRTHPFWESLRARHAAAAAYGHYARVHSGQPLIDPYARADWRAAQEAAVRSWHAGYYHTDWGAPVALVVPPTARMQTRWGWGVAQSTMSPLYQQFERPYPSATVGGMSMSGPMALRPTPRWPSHTDQFGVYSVRGPW